MKLHKALMSLFFVLSAVVSTTGALAVTVVVPDDFPTIQQAIDAASAGDTVYVRASTYYEHLTIGKSLTIEGEDRNTTIVDGSGSGNVIYASADYVTIDGLTVANGEDGIKLIANYTIDHFTIRNAVITGNSAYGFEAGHNNSSSYHTIENCIFSYNATCFYAHQFGNSVIRNCQVFENGAGFLVGWGSNTTISQNVFHDNTGSICIHIDSGTYNTIEDNELYDNGGSALSVGYVGAYNTFRNNIVRDNAKGIMMGGPSVYGNYIYNNEIMNNGTQAYDEQGDNFWDNGYPSGGNFWSDYTGVDLYSGSNQDVPGSDGIGDSPYAVNVAGVDHYPLCPGSTTLSAHLDIKPGSCPNPLNLTPFEKPGADAKPRKGGVLPAAILGTEDFDVSEIDASTLLLEGVPPLRYSFEDVSTPLEDGEECDCTDEGPDGLMDLTLKFQKSELAATLGNAYSGDVLPLTLTGQMNDGTPFEAMDCVVIVGKPADPRDTQKTDKAVVLGDAAPNPFNPITRISYVMQSQDLVRLSIYDVTGRLVERLVNEVQSPGEHIAVWNAGNHASGIYFYRVEVGSFTDTRKLVLVK
jgi:parallel beta-helix repeat protein